VIVVDASALLEVVLRRPGGPPIEARLRESEASMHAPHLIDVEIAQALRRFAVNGNISPDRGTQALAALVDLPLQRYPHHAFLPRIWELRENVTAYDAVYLALAETLDAPLVTRDRRLAAAPGHHARVEVY
jgi:predicted nucleic acid-binding protein